MSSFSRLYTALSSRKKAAYVALLYKLVRPISLTVDKLFPNRKLNSEKTQAVWIVSGPRSGSTISYQVLSRTLPCTFVSNAHYLAPNFYGKKLKSNFGWKNKSFKNFFGYSAGLLDVNEANELFDPVFNSNNNLIDKWKRLKNKLSNGQGLLLFKNVRNYKNIQKVADQCPDIKFLFIERDLLYNIQSIYLAYEKMKTFHPIPKHLEGINYNEDPIEFGYKQISYINQTIEKALSGLADDRYMKLSYKELCEDPRNAIIEISKWLKVNPENINLDYLNKIDLNESKSLKLNQDKVEQIKKLIN